jgi:hypothetical protein
VCTVVRHLVDDETHGSGAVVFMIVSLPAEAAETICCSIDLPIFALKD